MAFVSHRQADLYVQRPAAGQFLFLVFGTNSGLISERARQLLRCVRNPDFSEPRILIYSGDTLASDPHSLLNEINSPGLFDEGLPAIRILLGSRSIIPILETIGRSGLSETPIVVEGGALKRSSPIRQWFESRSFAAAIECAPDHRKDLSCLIDFEARAAGIAIETDAKEYLLNILGEDRLLLLLELEKLFLYKLNQTTINLNDTMELFSRSSTLSHQSTVLESFSGAVERVIDVVHNATNAPFDGQSVAIYALRHALGLHRARTLIDQGNSSDAVLQNLLRALNAVEQRSEVLNQLRATSMLRQESLIASFYELLKATRDAATLVDDRIFRELIKAAKIRQLQKRGSA